MQTPKKLAVKMSLVLYLSRFVEIVWLGLYMFQMVLVVLWKHDFRRFVLEIRNLFKVDEQDIAAALYACCDLTHGCLFVLSGVDCRCFNAFCLAVGKTLKENSDICEDVGCGLVNEFLDMLKNDSKYKSLV